MKYRRFSITADKTEEMGTLVKDNVKSKTPGIKHPGNLGQDETTKYENNRSRGKRRNPGQRNGKYLQQNHRIFHTLKEEMSIKVQEAYRMPNTLDQKRNPPLHIGIKTLNVQNKDNIKSCRGKRPSNI